MPYINNSWSLTHSKNKRKRNKRCAHARNKRDYVTGPSCVSAPANDPVSSCKLQIIGAMVIKTKLNNFDATNHLERMCALRERKIMNTQCCIRRTHKTVTSVVSSI